MDNHRLMCRPMYFYMAGLRHTTARLSQDCFQQAPVDVMLWPIMSPVLIKDNVWSDISRHINAEWTDVYGNPNIITLRFWGNKHICRVLAQEVFTVSISSVFWHFYISVLYTYGMMFCSNPSHRTNITGGHGKWRTLLTTDDKYCLFWAW